MNSTYPTHLSAAMAPSQLDAAEHRQQQTGGYLYQVATVLAILLLLISF